MSRVYQVCELCACALAEHEEDVCADCLDGDGDGGCDECGSQHPGCGCDEDEPETEPMSLTIDQAGRVRAARYLLDAMSDEELNALAEELAEADAGRAASLADVIASAVETEDARNGMRAERDWRARRGRSPHLPETDR